MCEPEPNQPAKVAREREKKTGELSFCNEFIAFYLFSLYTSCFVARTFSLCVDVFLFSVCVAGRHHS